MLHNSGGKPAEDIDIELMFPSGVTVAHEAPQAVTKPPKQPVRPRTQQELFETAKQALRYDFFIPPYHGLSNIDPSNSGPRIEGNTVSWWARGLKHGYVIQLGALFVTVGEPVRPFEISYGIHAANTVSRSSRTIVIKPSLLPD